VYVVPFTNSAYTSKTRG